MTLRFFTKCFLDSSPVKSVFAEEKVQKAIQKKFPEIRKLIIGKERIEEKDIKRVLNSLDNFNEKQKEAFLQYMVKVPEATKLLLNRMAKVCI